MYDLNLRNDSMGILCKGLKVDLVVAIKPT